CWVGGIRDHWKNWGWTPSIPSRLGSIRSGANFAVAVTLEANNSALTPSRMATYNTFIRCIENGPPPLVRLPTSDPNI
ncbi:hypothetical protein BJV78DRAFT_1261774, partial [Lactifluus subvellereus]